MKKQQSLTINTGAHKTCNCENYLNNSSSVTFPANFAKLGAFQLSFATVAAAVASNHFFSIDDYVLLDTAIIEHDRPALPNQKGAKDLRGGRRNVRKAANDERVIYTTGNSRRSIIEKRLDPIMLVMAYVAMKTNLL